MTGNMLDEAYTGNQAGNGTLTFTCGENGRVIATPDRDVFGKTYGTEQPRTWKRAIVGAAPGNEAPVFEAVKRRATITQGVGHLVAAAEWTGAEIVGRAGTCVIDKAAGGTPVRTPIYFWSDNTPQQSTSGSLQNRGPNYVFDYEVTAGSEDGAVTNGWIAVRDGRFVSILDATTMNRTTVRGNVRTTVALVDTNISGFQSDGTPIRNDRRGFVPYDDVIKVFSRALDDTLCNLKYASAEYKDELRAALKNDLSSGHYAAAIAGIGFASRLVSVESSTAGLVDNAMQIGVKTGRDGRATVTGLLGTLGSGRQ